MNYKITPLEDRHIEQLVDVHMQAFPGFFLSFLGPKFLKEFYRSFINDSAGIGFVAHDEQAGRVVGAIVGPLIPDGYFKRLLKKRWWAFCIASIKAVLKKPSISKRLFRAVFYRGESPVGPKRALLSSIAVAPDYQKFGIGRALVLRWVRQVADRGGTGCFLTTDADGNEAVNAFYQKLGWTVESSYTTPEGRRMNRYIFDINKSGDQDDAPN
jgi:ribosomal protein S18 acetylase RimI-like enzyme